MCVVQVHWKMRPISCAPHMPPSTATQVVPSYVRWRRARYGGRSSVAYPTACATAWTRNTSFPRPGKRPPSARPCLPASPCLLILRVRITMIITLPIIEKKKYQFVEWKQKTYRRIFLYIYIKYMYMCIYMYIHTHICHLILRVRIITMIITLRIKSLSLLVE